MSKYIDSNEARRIARLKNVRSSIGSSMTQHSGWQKQQIEKRRKEQLRKKREEAKKKPIGDGIKVETNIPVDYTTTGLKLKLKPSKKLLTGQKKPTAFPLPQQKPWQTNQVQVALPIDPVRRKQPAPTNRNANSATQLQTTEIQGRLKALSLSSNTNTNQNAPHNSTESKRHSFIPKFTGKSNACKSKFQTDEGKENGDTSFDQPGHCISRVSNLKKPGPKKHFQLLTDINSLKREHADALKMLQDLDKEENRRRSLGSASSASSFHSEESSEQDIFDKANRGGRLSARDFSDTYRASSCIDEYSVEEEVGICQDEYGDIVSSHEDESDNDNSETQTKPPIPDESFAWLPEGIKDASHLSIVLNDEIESQEDVDYKDIKASSVNGEDNFNHESSSQERAPEAVIELDDQMEDYDNGNDDDVASVADSCVYDEETSSSHEDEYLSDTSGY